MKPKDHPCHKFNSCSAPICPFEEGEVLRQSTWYPHEPICTRRMGSKITRKQRRIAVITGGDQNRGYFNLDMLKTRRVSKKIMGRDPDREKTPVFGGLSPLGVYFKHPSQEPRPSTPPPKHKRGGMNDGLRRYIEEKRKMRAERGKK